MNAMNRRKLITASAVLAIVGLAATALPAQAAEVGVSSTQIKLGMTLPMTGTASLGYNKIPGAAKAYFDYLNANGGINGRKVTLVVKDDRYVPTEAVAKTNELILKDKFVGLCNCFSWNISVIFNNKIDLAAIDSTICVEVIEVRLCCTRNLVVSK